MIDLYPKESWNFVFGELPANFFKTPWSGAQNARILNFAKFDEHFFEARKIFSRESVATKRTSQWCLRLKHVLWRAADVSPILEPGSPIRPI